MEQKTLRDELYPECKYVFFNKGKQLKDSRYAWDKAKKKAQLDEKLFHDLRRTGVRNLTRSGVTEVVAMRITGHKTRSVFDRYNIVNENDLRTANEQLTKHLDKVEKQSHNQDCSHSLASVESKRQHID